MLLGLCRQYPFFSVNSNLPDSLKNDLLGAGVLGFTDPEKFGPPTNPVLFQNDLDDPSHIPINIGEMSPQAYDTILDKANRDKIDKIARTGRYPNASDQKFLQDYLNNISDPARQQRERDRIYKLNGVWFPLASDSTSSPQDETQIALPPAAILAAMAALGLAVKGAESAWKLYRKYKQQIDQKVKEMQATQGQTA